MKEASTVAAMNLGGNFNGSLFDMVIHAGFVVQLVLLLLLFFSVVSWAIILMKYFNIRKVRKENELFLNAYMKSSKLSEMLPRGEEVSGIRRWRRSSGPDIRSSRNSPRRRGGIRREGRPGSGRPGARDRRNRQCGAGDEPGLRRTETTKLEAALGFLATTGSASPFIGLFGTVWGIMDTFKGIGARGSATLAVVAPGISEALIATAAGLAAAIPAVIFYNYYLNRIKNMTLEMDNFASELLNIVERYYVKK